MQIKEQSSDADFTYLTIKGQALTYDTSVVSGGEATGKITSSNYTDRVSSRLANSLAINLSIAAGSGSLAVNFLVLDPMEPSNGVTGVPTSPLPPPLVSLPLASGFSGAGTVRLVIANGVATVWVNNTPANLPGGSTNVGLGVPMLWQIQLQVSGTTPSFSVIGTFEEKR
jgi:hypothetical protein